MAKPNDIRVLFVRTGQTEWERVGRLAGSVDVPLTADGWTATRAAISEVQGARLSTILCGPDEASQAVARDLAKTTGGKVRVLEGLAEVHLGLWEGMLQSELQDKCPTTFRQWMDDPSAIHAPEGEAFEDAQTRLMEALERSLGKAKTEGEAIGVVLRPVALGLVGCAIAGVAIRSLWSMIDSSPAIEWRHLARASVRAAARAEA